MSKAKTPKRVLVVRDGTTYERFVAGTDQSGCLGCAGNGNSKVCAVLPPCTGYIYRKTGVPPDHVCKIYQHCWLECPGCPIVEVATDEELQEAQADKKAYCKKWGFKYAKT